MDLFENDNHIGFICLKNLTHVIAKRFHAMEDEVVQAAGVDAMSGGWSPRRYPD